MCFPTGEVISCKQHIVGSYFFFFFIHLTILYLLIREFNPFVFKVIIDR
jgi:hypothetical protein